MSQAIISDIEMSLNATNILLIFVTVLFGLQYPLLAVELSRKVWPEKKQLSKRRQEQRRILKSILPRWMPVPLLALTLTYVHLPLYWKVVSSSTFSLWEFDLLATAYFLIVSYLLIFCVWTLYATIRLLALSSYLGRS